MRTEYPQVNAIIEAAYAPGEVVERGELQLACGGLLHEVSRQSDPVTAQTYLAHVLQELRIADYQLRTEELQTPVDRNVDLSPLFASDGRVSLQHAIRFNRTPSGMLAPETVLPGVTDLSTLPVFDQLERLRGKKILAVGMGGGSDVVQGAAVSEVSAMDFGSSTVVFGSVRKAQNQLLEAGRHPNSPTLKRIQETTKADGDWRFLEGMFLADQDPLAETPMYIINSINADDVQRDLELLRDMYQPDVIIGVDTGGDSFYKTDKEAGFSGTATDSSPDQDLEVILALHRLSVQSKAEGKPIDILTAVPAVGVDSPPYIKRLLHTMNSSRLPIRTATKQRLLGRYNDWRMDGSGNDENRYGKTALAWQAAMAGRYGLQLLDLPVANVIAAKDTWRTFLEITPAMGEVVLTDIEQYA